VPSPTHLRAATVQVGRLREIAQLEVEPAETVEQTVVDRLVTDLLGQAEALVIGGERRRVVALARQGEAAQEGAEEQGDEQVVLAGERADRLPCTRLPSS
jgi:hypothetical protein